MILLLEKLQSYTLGFLESVEPSVWNPVSGACVIDPKLFLEEGGWSTGEVEGTLKLSCPEFYPERAPTG